MASTPTEYSENTMVDGLKSLCEEYACPCHFEMKTLKPEHDKLRAEVERLKGDGTQALAGPETINRMRKDIDALQKKLDVAECQLGEAKDALQTIFHACDGVKDAALLSIGSIARRGLKYIKNVKAIRLPSAERVALARKAIKALDAENKVLAGMTPEEREKYIDQWADRLAADLAKLND